LKSLANVHGAHGAKGIGELPMDGPAPAIVNAVEDAIGVGFQSIPLLPEDLFEALRPASVEQEAPSSTRGRHESAPETWPRSAEVLFTVNGKAKKVLVHPMERLLDVLRNELELTGTKEGCGEGECGSCSVLLDGMLVE